MAGDWHVLDEYEYPILDVRQVLGYRRRDDGSIRVRVTKIRELEDGRERGQILLHGTIPASPDETDET